MKPNIYQDANNFALGDTDWGLKEELTLTFADAVPGRNVLFSVTGTVLLRVLAVCKTLIAGASSTIEVGIDGNTAKLIAQITATNLIAGEIWHDASPDSKVELSSVLAENIVSDDVILTVATANVTSGVIKFIALWYPLSKDGNVQVVKGNAMDAQSSSLSSSESSSSSSSKSASISLSPSSSSSSSKSSSESKSASSSISRSGSASASLTT